MGLNVKATYKHKEIKNTDEWNVKWNQRKSEMKSKTENKRHFKWKEVWKQPHGEVL